MISTHVLDTARGRPAEGVPVALDALGSDGDWRDVSRAQTDADGRVRELVGGGTLGVATYRLTFDTATYFRSLGSESFYPTVSVVFSVVAPTPHYHVPLLLSPFGYATYRGS